MSYDDAVQIPTAEKSAHVKITEDVQGVSQEGVQASEDSKNCATNEDGAQRISETTVELIPTPGPEAVIRARRPGRWSGQYLLVRHGIHFKGRWYVLETDIRRLLGKEVQVKWSQRDTAIYLSWDGEYLCRAFWPMTESRCPELHM